MKVYKQESLGPAHEIVLGKIRPGAKVLEVGCATGHMTRALKERLGCIVTAIELDLEQARLASDYAEKMIIGNAEDPEIWDSIHEKFDYVIFGDVLEHLVNPSSVLRNCKRVLACDGCVLASIPNVAYYKIRLDLLRGRFDYTDYGILDNTHLRFFTEKTARALFIESGYTINSIIPIYRRRCGGLVGIFFGFAFAYQFVLQASPSS